MSPAGRSRPSASLSFVVLAAVCGLAATLWLWHEARVREEMRRDAEFERQVDARHALIRETLAGYEDCLVSLKLLFTYDHAISGEEFTAAVRQQSARHPGFVGVLWAPTVTASERPGWEKKYAAELPGGIRQTNPDRSSVPAGNRPFYHPVLYAEPLEPHRRLVACDLSASALSADITQARSTDRSVMSGLLTHLYDTGPGDGIILICPVGASVGAGSPSAASGVLFGMFRVAGLFGQGDTPSLLEAAIYDDSAARADRRLLSGQVTKGGAVPTEAEFRSGRHRELGLPVSGRNWRFLYRPVPGAGDHSLLPSIVLVAGLLITSLGTGFLASQRRRANLVELLVNERTAELAESRRELDRFLRKMPGMAFRGVYDNEERLTVTYVSEGALALTGWTPADFISGQVQMREIIHPDDLPHTRSRISEAIGAREQIEMEYRIRAKDGQEKWVLARGHGIFMAGAPLVIEGLVIDVTAQKTAETERLALERKFLESQKLESLGLLAGGIAHDFNNLLTSILGNAGIARLALPPGNSVDTELDAIETGATRAAELCRQMLAYAGKGRFVVEAVDVSTLAEGLVPLLEVSIARKATLRLALNRELPAVMADATQLRQIVMNLVLNAVDAVDEQNGEIQLSTGLVRADRALLDTMVAGPALAEGDYVFLEVRDNGTGMPPEVLARIFDPFFTTKFAGRGLGLAAVLGIVRGHKAALAVHSTPGRGSCFRLLVPAAANTLVVKAPPPPPASGWKCSGHALVVDDDEPVRLVASVMLKSFGFTVRTVSNGQSGIDAFRENPAAFTVILLDLLMPGLTGEQTLEILRTIQPDVRVLIISGFSESDVMQRLAKDRGPFKFLHKPFKRPELEQKLRELLD